MTGRERLQAIFHREPVDRLSWTTLVDDATLGALPPSLGCPDGLSFYRHLGCDVLLLNGWGTEFRFRNPIQIWPEGTETATRSEGALEIREMHTPSGTLTATFRRHHPVKPPVVTVADLRVYLELWQGSRFEWSDDSETYAGLTDAIGDDGVAMAFWGPSTVPQLLEFDMGTEGFYYMLQDEPALMDELISTMHRRQLRAFEHLARGPFEVISLVENTSTTYISPDIYQRYNGPHVRDFVDAVHDQGKVPIIHMCGHVRGLLDQIKDTGLDGVHALTPTPTGDTPFELALDVLGEDQIIIGVLDPSIFISGPIEEIGPALEAIYTPRVRRSNFVLGPFADGIAVPLERFEAVARWMERNSAL